jgi:hypothetical protein
MKRSDRRPDAWTLLPCLRPTHAHPRPHAPCLTHAPHPSPLQRQQTVRTDFPAHANTHPSRSTTASHPYRSRVSGLHLRHTTESQQLNHRGLRFSLHLHPHLLLQRLDETIANTHLKPMKHLEHSHLQHMQHSDKTLAIYI